MKYLLTRAMLGVAVCTFAVVSAEMNKTCGMTKTCLFFPDGCDLTDDTTPCRFVSWTKSDTVPDSINIELRSALLEEENPYIAVALGRSEHMQDADMYFCKKDGMGTGAITTRWATPVELPLSNDVTLLSSSLENKYLHCKFNRPFAVKKQVADGSEFDYDISAQSFHILIAEGEMKEDFVDHHKWRGFTSEAVNLTKNFELEEIFKIPLDTTPAVVAANTTAPMPKQNDTDVIATSKPKVDEPDGGNVTQEVPQVTDKPEATTTSGSTSAFVKCWSLMFICLSLAQF